MIETFIPIEKALIGPGKGKPLSEEMKDRIRTAIRTRVERRDSVWAYMTEPTDEEEE